MFDVVLLVFEGYEHRALECAVERGESQVVRLVVGARLLAALVRT